MDKLADFIVETFLTSLNLKSNPQEEYSQAKFFEELEKSARAEGREEAAERWAGIASAFKQIGLRLSS